MSTQSWSPAGYQREIFISYLLSLALLLGGLILDGAVAQDAQENDATQAPRLALLIGVSEYANLSAADQLHGSGNDVEAVRHLLVSRFGFDQQNINTLIDEQATGAAIRQAFESLAQQVAALPDDGPKAQVYFHFSGHGSQLSDQGPGDPNRDEDDGLDDTLVPYDATPQGGDEDIRDDEIDELVHQICGGEKAQMFLVYDCCHSGTGARGATRVRQLVRKDLQAAKPTDGASPVSRKSLPQGVVFLRAGHEREVEPEFLEGDKSYGLLSRFLVGVLSEEEVVSRISYDLLPSAIIARYRRDRRVMQAPHPQIEASDMQSLRSSILGAGPDVDQSAYYVVEKDSSNTLRLSAGIFHNVSVGSMFEVYARPEDITSATDDNEDSNSQFWMRITNVQGVTSQGQVIQWSDEAQAAFQDGQVPAMFRKGIAVQRYHQPAPSGVRLKVVRVQGDGDDGPPLSPDDQAIPMAVSSALTGITKADESEWLTWVTDEDPSCDVVLRMDGDFAALFPANGKAEVPHGLPANPDIPQSLRGGWGPIDLRSAVAVRTADDADATPLTLNDYLRRITRARNLISLVLDANDSQAADYQVECELVKVLDFDEDFVILDWETWEPERDGVVMMREGQKYALRITNHDRGSKPVYVTVLEISPNMGITVVMPEQEMEVQLGPGESRFTPIYECYSPYGPWYAVVLATREPHDLKFVAQADLPTTRGAQPWGGPASLTDRLLEETFFKSPATRGRPLVRQQPPDSSWYAALLTYQAVPASYGTRTRGAPSYDGPGLVRPADILPVLEDIQKQLATKADSNGESSTISDEQGYQRVKVFYGTDRKAIRDPGQLRLGLPIRPLSAAVVTAIFVFLARTRPRRWLWGSLAVLGLLATVGFGTSDVLSWTRQSQAMTRIGMRYGNERGELEVGFCEVSIPQQHNVGALEAPSILRFEVRENPEKHVVLQRVEPQEQESFFGDLRDVVQKSPRKEVFLFIHGYYVSFEDAARRTGQMTYDLKFEGAPIFYSWPSQADFTKYTVDENNVEWTVPNLKQFLLDVTHRSGAQAVNLVAHSMGNRALTKALQEISYELGEEETLFNQVILAAPDIDADVFRDQIAPRIIKNANRVTLYASSNDNALVASKKVHGGHPRAGESGENIVVVEGIDTIDVSSIDTSLVGHNYFGDSNSIVADMFILLHKAEPAERRPWLHQALWQDMKYWIFKGEDSHQAATPANRGG